MSPTNDFDIGPLSWVKPEIDATLNRARESLDEFQRNPGSREPLRFAQGHMHQASGALSLVGLDGVAQFAEAIDKLLSAQVADESTPPAEQVTLVLRGIAVLANYLNELMAGATHQPLRLFPVYQELVTARGGETPAQSELFFPDLSVRPALAQQPASQSPERTAHELRLLRGRFEKGLLAWIRKPGEATGPTEMLAAVRRIEQISALPATRAFWWAAIAYFEGLALRAIAPDRQAHRLCRRIDTQMRRLIEGSQIVAERLVRDVLYFVAAHKIQSEHATAVRKTYALEKLLPSSANAALSDTLRQPVVLRVRESLEHVKEAWNRFCAGAAVALPVFQEQLEELRNRTRPLKLQAADRLLDAMMSLADWLRADPLRYNDELAMEVATALLVLEQVAESPAYDQNLLARQVDLLCAIYAARQAGNPPPALDDSLFGEASQRAQERLFFNQLAREILTNLGQIEQTLDAFFRNPSAQRESLPGLAGPLKQIEGAFAVLGEASAAKLVRNAAAEIEGMANTSEAPAVETCEKLAHNLSALGFYVEALKGGPAQLERFLNPEAKAAEADIAASAETVEAQLARETRETHSIAEALKDAPENDALRQQLVSSLEAIREDAHLLANSELEQQTKEAIASIKAGGDILPDQLDVALAGVVPASAPQPSEEAARLMQASAEELDKELLEIFLEEANEVVATQSASRHAAAANPHDVEALTTIRRGFHTLKGSSRMVGLTDFSEAARHVEMTMNRWLQLEKDASSEILSLIDTGIVVFTAWVKQLEAGGSLWYDANALIAQAQALLSSLDVPPGEDSPPIPRFGVATAPVIAAAAETLGSSVSPEPALAVDTLDFELDADGEGSLDAGAPTLAFDTVEVENEASVPAGTPAEEPETEYMSSLEATRLDADALRAFEAGGPELIDNPAPLMPEMDLSATQLEGDLAALDVGGTELNEIDLTATLMDGDPLLGGGLDFDLGSEDEPALTHAPTSEDEIGLEEAPNDLVTTSLDFDLRGEQEEEEEPQDLGEAPIVTDALADAAASADAPVEPDALVPPQTLVHAEPPSFEPAPAALVSAPSAAAEKDEELEVVSIEDELDTRDEDLPVVDLSMLGGVEPLAEAHIEAQAEAAAKAEQVASPDSEVSIGSVMLSRALYDLYLAEARQHIASLKEEQARLQGSPLHVPQAPAIRAAHTLAGISGTARMESVLDLARALEHALHRFEELAMAPDAVQSAAICTTVDTLAQMVDTIAMREEPAPEPEQVAQLEALWPHEPEPAVSAPLVAEPEVILEEGVRSEPEEPISKLDDDLDEQLLPIFFEEAEELNQEIGALLRQMRADPADQASAQALARVYHTLKGSARMAGAMRLGEFVHGLETRLEHASSQKQVDAAVVDELEHGLDQIGNMIELLRNPAAEPELVETEAFVAAEPLAEHVDREPGQTPAILLQQPEPVALVEEDALQAVRSLVRVRADMVDRFVNEAGEISIARTRVEGEMRTLRRSLLDLTDNVIRLRNQLREVEISAESQMQSRIAAAESQHANFDPLEFDRFTRLQEITRMMAESVGDVTTIQQNLLRNLDSADAALHAQGRLSRDLQQALMGVRMVPFEDIAERLYRVVRQTAKELGKRANLDIRGGRIEIDRGVLDKMVAPLEHLLRNAIAHGIEMPEERLSAGKPEIGQITLTLTQLSNEIALDMQDDGRGLNFERILSRGRSVGLIGAEEQPSEGRLTQLIFEPGFSTAETVSGIAGRGVGMDVVKNETLSVGGRIDTSTTPGQGTRFLIHLPLTLAVTQALLVRSAERTYAIPSNMVEQALELKEAALEAMREQGYAEWKEQRYPLRYLPRLLGDRETQAAQSRFHWVLLLRAGNETLALQIDELRGNQEIIVKNAGPQFVRLQGFTGATVLADGEISLILNPVVLASRGSAAEDEMAPEATAPAQEERVPTVMVVDDSLTVRKITSRLLEREGYQVVTAKDGVDALEQLVDMKPDVMLLDIEMPRMDGFDLARNIRADERLRSIPIIMITSRMADKHRNYAFEIGVNHYLGKPYQEEQLLELIAGFVRQQR